VNDLGGSVLGEGQTENPAEQVVNEIQRLGGEAFANAVSVADPAAVTQMVATAVSRWGQVDILVNNASI
jgi:NAD(P)-dependent dehydrogenase (short-subunit alcohol dehydrogenase family)